MANAGKPPAAEPAREASDPGVSKSASTWSDDVDAESLAALEEYRRTGESHSIEEAMAELDQLIADRRAEKA
ncbi:MAG: hypothetical protein V4466_03915 [Pseudomonadota bacterium]